ncbi:hypothetical protein Droror1_Dr00006662 [Drosera rotundifolia]
MAISLSTLTSSLSTLTLSSSPPLHPLLSPHRRALCLPLRPTLKPPKSFRVLAADAPEPGPAQEESTEEEDVQWDPQEEESTEEEVVQWDRMKLDLSEYVKERLSGGFAAQWYMGTGRRKCAIARVVLLEGNGKVIINNRSAREYLQDHPMWVKYVRAPLKILGLETSVDVFVKAHGGGLSGQAQAICLGVARALLKVNANYRKALKVYGLLTRDSRVVERKKAGLKKARKAPQYSKR